MRVALGRNLRRMRDDQRLCALPKARQPFTDRCGHRAANTRINLVENQGPRGIIALKRHFQRQKKPVSSGAESVA